MQDVLIKVGQPFTAFKSNRGLDGQMKTVFEAFDDDRGYLFAVYLPNIQENDINDFSDLRIETRIVRKNGISFPLFRFGKTDLLFDVIFNPFLYDSKKGFQMLTQNNHVTFVLIDANTNIVRTIRYATMSMKLRDLWTESWLTFENPSEFTMNFNKGTQLLFQQSLYHLWKQAIPTSYFGVIEDISDSTN